MNLILTNNGGRQTSVVTVLSSAEQTVATGFISKIKPSLWMVKLSTRRLWETDFFSLKQIDLLWSVMIQRKVKAIKNSWACFSSLKAAFWMLTQNGEKYSPWNIIFFFFENKSACLSQSGVWEFKHQICYHLKLVAFVKRSSRRKRRFDRWWNPRLPRFTHCLVWQNRNRLDWEPIHSRKMYFCLFTGRAKSRSWVKSTKTKTFTNSVFW